ncbi:MAG: hypothetical protein ACRD0K_26755 [Egibacteraceae bacterium]
MSTPTSLRLDDATKDRLRAQAEREQMSTAALAQRLINEGLRIAAHPGVVFRDGPAGRRPSLIAGPDVAEVASVMRHLDDSGDEAVAETARWLEIPESAVRAAIDYYVEFTDEIDQEITRREQAAEAARQHWERRQQLLA